MQCISKEIDNLYVAPALINRLVSSSVEIFSIMTLVDLSLDSRIGLVVKQLNPLFNTA